KPDQWHGPRRGPHLEILRTKALDRRQRQNEIPYPSRTNHQPSHTFTRDNRIMRLDRAPLLLIAFTLAASAQDVRPKDVRETAKSGSVALPVSANFSSIPTPPFASRPSARLPILARSPASIC